MLSLHGSADQQIHFNGSTPTLNISWSGIVIEKNSRKNGVNISNVVISGSDAGLRIRRDGAVNISFSRFSNNNKGVHILSENANVAIAGSQFINNNIGVDIVDRGKFAIFGCQFTRHHVAAIRASRNSSRSQPETLSITSSLFAQNNGALNLKLSYRTSLCLVRNTFVDEPEQIFASIKLTVWHSNVTVDGNTFLRIKSEALLIVANESTSIIVIRNNTWKYGKKTLSILHDGRYGTRTTEHTTTIEKNVFHANSGGMYLTFKGNTTARVMSNEFTENTGRATIYLMESTIPLKIYSNRFYMNVVSGVITAHSPIVIINNSFNNPDSSHDLVMFAKGVTNATYNWWGVDTRSAVASRIQIIENDPRIVVNLDPFLTRDPLMSCAKVANCSNHGLCVGVNTCRCDAGWLSPNCSQATCSGVDNCSGHGRCVAPNRYDDTEV